MVGEWREPHTEPIAAVPVAALRMIHEPGSEVTIWGDVKARIDYAIVETGKTSCRVRFWNGTSLASEVVDEGMILAGDQKAVIGFK